MTLTRDTILSADDLPKVLVPVPEWGGDVYVRSLTANERDFIELMYMDLRDDKKAKQLKLRATVCAMSIVDESGKRLFSESDIEALGRKSYKALDRVKTAAEKLNALTADEVDELEKNSETTRA